MRARPCAPTMLKKVLIDCAIAMSSGKLLGHGHLYAIRHIMHAHVPRHIIIAE